MDAAKLQMDVGEAVLQVCHAVQGRLQQGYYNDLSMTVSKAWPSLLQARKHQKLPLVDPEEDNGVRKARRLDRASIVKHWRKHGPRGTYVATTCDKVLDDGSRATLLFVMPKFALHFAAERHQDMTAAVQLGLAQTVEEVQQACRHPETQCYDVRLVLFQSSPMVFENQHLNVYSVSVSRFFSCLS